MGFCIVNIFTICYNLCCDISIIFGVKRGENMILPQKREDFDDFYILCEDVNSYDFAFKDCSFNETMEIMLKLNNNRNNEFRMELCFDNPYLPEEKSIPLFCIGVLVVDGVASGYVNIHYSDIMKKECPIDLARIEKKMYGDYAFYSDIILAIKGIEVIKRNFDVRLVPSKFL